mgnify:FL=1
MSFGFTPDIPSIPGLSTITSPAGPGLSDSAKSAISALTSQARDTLFNNPMTDVLHQTTDNIGILQQRLTEIASGNVINASITAGDATTFLAGTGISNLQTSLASFTAHTDRLSGVLKGVGINTPGLEQIVTIGKQMNTTANLIDGGSGCLNIIGSATGLFSQDQIGAEAAGLADLVTRIDNGIVTIADVTTAVVTTKNTFDAIVNKDTNFLGQCVEQLKSSAFGMVLSTVMSDPCAKFIMERTGTPSFLSKLQLPPTPSIGGR